MILMAKPNLGEDEQLAVKKVFESGMIACGEVVSEFEKSFAEYIGVLHGIATTSGTTALEVALRAVGIGNGDKVLTTPFSFIASTNSIIYSGAIPIFADIDPHTLNICPDAMERQLALNPDIKAVLIVHLFGLACNMDRIIEIAKKNNLLIIEDCAQAHGTMWKGKKAGSFGDISAFSFYPTKNMTTGEGGIVLTDNSEFAQRSRLLINHGMKIRYYHDIIGYNYRMTNIAASIGLCQLKKLPDMNKARFKNAVFYNEKIKNILLQPPHFDEGHVYHQYTIQVQEARRDDFVAYLESLKIGYGIFYPLTIPEQACYKEYGFENNAAPEADSVKNKVISIPVHPLLTQNELDFIINALNKFR